MYVLLFIGFVCLNEVLIFSFLFVEYNLKALYKPREYPAASFGHYIRNYWVEIVLILGKYYLYPVRWLNLSLNVDNKNDTAILLIHGYCRSQSDWLWMRKQLQRNGCPIFCLNLEPMLAPLQEIVANSLPAKIASIKEQTNCKNLILIAHSMGGLVSSYYSEFMDDQKLVKAIITIGTPFYGTKIAIAGPGENAKQMCPGSAFLTELHVPMHKTQTKYYQVCSRFDNKVFPWQSALLELSGDEHHFVLPFTAHLELLYSKEVAKQLNNWIQAIVAEYSTSERKIPA